MGVGLFEVVVVFGVVVVVLGLVDVDVVRGRVVDDAGLVVEVALGRVLVDVAAGRRDEDDADAVAFVVADDDAGTVHLTTLSAETGTETAPSASWTVTVRPSTAGSAPADRASSIAASAASSSRTQVPGRRSERETSSVRVDGSTVTSAVRAGEAPRAATARAAAR